MNVDKIARQYKDWNFEQFINNGASYKLGAGIIKFIKHQIYVKSFNATEERINKLERSHNQNITRRL